MVYLAREEDTDQAEIEWSFDFTTKNNGLNIADISLRFDSKTYEDGLINIRFKHNGMQNDISRYWKNGIVQVGLIGVFIFRWNFTEHWEHPKS